MILPHYFKLSLNNTAKYMYRNCRFRKLGKKNIKYYGCLYPDPSETNYIISLKFIEAHSKPISSFVGLTKFYLNLNMNGTIIDGH